MKPGGLVVSRRRWCSSAPSAARVQWKEVTILFAILIAFSYGCS